ncbi:deoxynucleoside triphosphate triphosphohydrolase SAMHD1-like [Hypanus sabinus]|uniref:deoxynucleoside triphosphate triphosphohydrolase SAMHD1-like n=1 Tax=Hypanus sabinus TaxID=79690 RepID=UPI0028C40312|nr:deoxynucleoside triphosphate triphosphohydrolase SAMHD1-like [Hypanus sabinus]
MGKRASITGRCRCSLCDVLFAQRSEMSSGSGGGKRRSRSSGREDAGCGSSKRIAFPSSYLEWDVDDVCRFLREQGLGEFEELFRDAEISGATLAHLTMNKLESMGVSLPGNQRKLYISILNLLERFIEIKVFNDPIHGHIEMHPLLVHIIDTLQFQRLRFIKQLGGTYFVYPGASHNRFEHSIGVAHLAGELVKVLARRQPELQVDDRDILCVQIAGLCHDLGHGPFSHLFDRHFISKTRQDVKWKHEMASIMMFDHMISSNNLDLRNYGLVVPGDVDFIKELINGPEGGEASEGSEWPYKGRPKEKSFLYEIVANKRTGIDVDKWDYFVRDSYHLGIPNNFDYQRILKYARVCEVDNMKVICFRDKVAGDLYNMFYTRNALHRRAYQHRVVKIIESMITEAMVLADPHILISGSGGRQYRMSTAIDDMEAYTKLTDSIFEQILNSSQPELEEARTILNNIRNRRLYRCIGQAQAEDGQTQAEEGPAQAEQRKTTKKEKIAKLKTKLVEAVVSEQVDVKLEAKDLIVNVIPMNYGMQEKNPINNVRFYRKNNPDKAFKIRREQVSQMLPEKFLELLIQVFCKKTDKKTVEAAKGRFFEWCRTMKFSNPWDHDDIDPAPM